MRRVERRNVRLSADEVTQIAELAPRIDNVLGLRAGSASEGLPPVLLSVVSEVVKAVGAGQAISISAMPDELTSTDAASALGISRPTLMKYVADGRLKSHKVGSHHRFLTSDVMAFRGELQEAQRQAVWDLLDSEPDD